MEEQLKQLEIQLAEIEAAMGDPNASADQVTFKKLSQEHNRLSGIVRIYSEVKKLSQEVDETRELLADDSEDEEMKAVLKDELPALEEKLEAGKRRLEMALLPPDPNSGKNVIIEIRAGTGGDEAALFAGDLFKMYMRYAESRGLSAEIINTDPTGIGGYKEVVLAVKGGDAYDLFVGEGGGHRVQRIPVTESGGRIHTSAATVAVVPEAEETEVDIKEADLRVDYYRSSGAGGQHVNTTDSAVRLTHIPTGIVVTCQDEKSQHKNKAKAMRVLRSRIAQKQVQEEKAKTDAEKKEMIGSGDRSQRIRTYNFPQNRITDHRAGYTAHNLEQVLAGQMDELVEAVVAHRRKLQMEAAGR